MRIGDGSSDVCFSDLIYLFTGDHLAESDGPRSLGATTYYNRLAQRLTGAMPVPTAAGTLYAVETRRRPQGAQGRLVVPLTTLHPYQPGVAWTGEHLAVPSARQNGKESGGGKV